MRLADVLNALFNCLLATDCLTGLAEEDDEDEDEDEEEDEDDDDDEDVVVSWAFIKSL